MSKVSSTEKGLQSSINCLCNYLSVWKLKLNTTKTQVIVFNKCGRLLKKFSFYYNNSQLTVVPQYKYLGLTIRSSGKVDFEGLCSKSLNASFLMRKIMSFEEMNGQLEFKLFDS